MNLNDTTTALARAAHTLSTLPPDLPPPYVVSSSGRYLTAAWYGDSATPAVLASLPGHWTRRVRMDDRAEFIADLDGVELVVSP